MRVWRSEGIIRRYLLDSVGHVGEFQVDGAIDNRIFRVQTLCNPEQPWESQPAVMRKFKMGLPFIDQFSSASKLFNPFCRCNFTVSGKIESYTSYGTSLS